MVSPEQPIQQYARVVWQKRLNNIGQSAYLGPADGGKVFAVGVLGSVVIDWEDMPHCVRLLRDMADAMELHYETSRPQPPPQPARRRTTRRGSTEDKR